MNCCPFCPLHTSQFHADELPTKAGIERLDRWIFRDFLKNQYGRDFPDEPSEQLRLLQNLNLAAEDDSLNLAGVLLFAVEPELVFLQFVAKGVRFPGIAIHADTYEDTEDFTGPLSRLFKDALAFVMRNLHKIQGKNGVNSPGTPEIPERVFEELLVNALVHRDYLVSSPVRIFIFDDRVEIISPGTLPNNLTVANIRAGNSNIRNPILVSYVAKGLLPYHGIGSGIVRALDAWPDIEFEDNREESLFRAIVRRKKLVSGAKQGELAPEIAPEFSALLCQIKKDPSVTSQDLATALNVSRRTVLYRITRLKEMGLLRRTGPNKGGSWQIGPF